MELKTFILASFLILCSCHTAIVKEYAIIPQPVQIEYKTGTINLKRKPGIAFPADLYNEAKLLQSYLDSDFSMQAELKEGEKKATITLQLDPTVLPEQQEGYLLDAS